MTTWEHWPVLFGRVQRRCDLKTSMKACCIEYLLGNLPEAEQVRVEDRAFTDAEYLNALEASESDLIDTYVRGGLSPADRRAFERQFLTSPNRRRKVEFAKALAKVAAESTLVQKDTASPPDLELDSGLVVATSAGCRCPDGFAIGCSSVGSP